MNETLEFGSKAWEFTEAQLRMLIPAWYLIIPIAGVILFNLLHSGMKRWRRWRRIRARGYMPQVLEGYVIALNHLQDTGVISLTDKITEMRRLKSCGFNINLFTGGLIDTNKLHAHLVTVKHEIKKGRAKKQSPVVRTGKVVSFS